MDKTERVILNNLIHDDAYARHVIPFLSSAYFHDKAEREVFKEIQGFFNKYNAIPDYTALSVELSNRDIVEGVYKEVKEVLSEIEEPRTVEYDWLVDTTEKFCKDKAIYNAILKSIKIIDGEDKNNSPEALPSLLQEALAVSFDKSVGHDFFDNAEDRYDLLHKKENKLRFDLEMFNKVTKGGVPPKTLNAVLAPTGVGKSLFLCHLAAAYVKNGIDTLYITLEMAEERIAERIDCNIMDMQLDEVEKLSKKNFTGKLDDIKNKTHGRLIIKEYANSSAHAGHFRALMDELELKKNFKPKVVIIDYLNICASQRASRNDNSYTLVKKIAEELRALGQEYNVPVWTATQTNRGGANNSDIAITDTSESFGLPMTLDFLFALVRTEELDAMGQLLCIQLKSRYNNINFHRKFVVGVDITMFKLFDVEQTAQDDVDQGPAFDKSKFGEEMHRRGGDRREELDFS